jgi:hypothetical protein
MTEQLKMTLSLIKTRAEDLIVRLNKTEIDNPERWPDLLGQFTVLATQYATLQEELGQELGKIGMVPLNVQGIDTMLIPDLFRTKLEPDMEIEEKEIIENYYVDMKEQDEDTVELEQKIENYQLLCEALEEHFVELRDKEKDKFKKALQQPQDLSLMVTGKPAKSPKVQGLLEDLAINSPLLTIDALLNDGEGIRFAPEIKPQQIPTPASLPQPLIPPTIQATPVSGITQLNPSMQTMVGGQQSNGMVHIQPKVMIPPSMGPGAAQQMQQQSTAAQMQIDPNNPGQIASWPKKPLMGPGVVQQNQGMPNPGTGNPMLHQPPKMPGGMMVMANAKGGIPTQTAAATQRLVQPPKMTAQYPGMPTAVGQGGPMKQPPQYIPMPAQPKVNQPSATRVVIPASVKTVPPGVMKQNPAAFPGFNPTAMNRPGQPTAIPINQNIQLGARPNQPAMPQNMGVQQGGPGPAQPQQVRLQIRTNQPRIGIPIAQPNQPAVQPPVMGQVANPNMYQVSAQAQRQYNMSQQQAAQQQLLYNSK